MTKQCIAKWLNGAYFKENIDSVKWEVCACRCGATMCFGCLLDQIIVGIDHAEVGELRYQCPNCRYSAEAIDNLNKFYNLLAKSPSLRGLSDSQRALLKKYAEYDGSKKALAVVRKKQASFRSVFYRAGFGLIKRGESVDSDSFLSKLSANAFAIAKRGRVCVTQTTAAPIRTRHGCANCGKQFWDAISKKRAPKCTKCKRVTYCNAKCRKAHKKTHAPNCKKLGKPQKKQLAIVKRKPAEKQKKAKSCKPY